MDGGLRQVPVHRCGHNRSVIHPNMAAPADSWGEKNRMKQSFDDKKIAQVSEMLQIVNE